MSAADPIDAGRLSLALNDLRLPAIKLIWPDFAARADKEGWPAARLLATLVEHELAERANRRIQRHLEEARLPPGKTLDNFDFEAIPMLSKAQVMALAAGDSWLEKGANMKRFQKFVDETPDYEAILEMMDDRYGEEDAAEDEDE